MKMGRDRRGEGMRRVGGGGVEGRGMGCVKERQEKGGRGSSGNGGRRGGDGGQ